MELLYTLIDSGRIVDIMLAVVLLEVLLLLWWWRSRRTGVPPVALLVNVGAGSSLMMALRAALMDQGTLAIAVCLVSSLVFHTADLVVRWTHSATVRATSPPTDPR